MPDTSPNSMDAESEQKREHGGEPADAAEKEEGDTDDGEKKRRGLKETLKAHPYLTVAGIVILLIALAGVVIWWLHARHFEETDDAFIDARQFSIAPKVQGYVADVQVTDNQHVNQGVVLLRVDDRDYKVAMEQANAQVAAAEAGIANIDAQISAQLAQVEQAQSDVKQAEAALKFSAEDAARYQKLATLGTGSVQKAQQSTSQLQEQQANFERTKAGVNAAEKQIAALQAQRTSALADMQRAQAQRDQAALNLDYTVLTAAQAGHVVHLSAAKGEYVEPGQSVMMFVPDEIWVTANFKETQITDMRSGQPVDIEIDAYPDIAFHGHVVSIQTGSGTAFSLLPAENATGNFVKVVQRVPVKIEIDNPPANLVLGPGLSVVPRVRVR